MKIAVLSSASAGGAGIAAYRIFEAIKSQQSHAVDFFDMTILDSTIDEVSPQQSATNQKISNTHFTIDYANGCRAWLIDLLIDYDYLNIHWSSYLLSIAEILTLADLGKNILFTLHDFYYITGGCHYPAGCTGYREHCVGCPQVNENLYEYETVIYALKLKREIFSHPNVHLSAPSSYIVDLAVNSGIIPEERGHVLRNVYNPLITPPAPLDPTVFSLLLISDSFFEERKGFVLAINSIIEFCKREKTHSHKIRLHVVGSCKKDIYSLLADTDLSLVLHGHVREHTKLVEIFQQCQFMLTCSYEDNWPNILVEAGAYGCIPIVGIGHGCEEFCREFDTGLIASDYTPESFADCLLSAYEMSNDSRSNKSRDEFIDRVRAMHSYANVSDKYIAVFSEISDAEGVKLRKSQPQEVKTTGISVFAVSENFLGQITRSMLARNKTKQLEFNSIKLTVEDTPFANETIANGQQVIVIFDDQSSRQFSVEPGNNVDLPIYENGRSARSVFMAKSNSFGLRQVRIQFEKQD